MPKRIHAKLAAGDVLRYQCMVCNLTMAAAARKLGLDPRTFRRYVRGHRDVPRYLPYAMLGLITELKGRGRIVPKAPRLDRQAAASAI